MWFGSLYVTIHSRTNAASITAAALEILPHLSPGDAILVESFCEPVVRVQSVSPAARQMGLKSMDPLGFRIRACVCRNPENEAVMTSITCGVGVATSPINGDNTIVQNLEATLQVWGIRDLAECKAVEDDIKAKSEATLNAIMAFENTLPLSLKGSVGAQTDLIGIDYVMCREDGLLSAIPIEVNSHDCTINNQLYEFINPSLSGEAVKPFVQTMLNRSMKYMMQGKQVLVIGAGGYSKTFIWEAAKEYGIKIYLLDYEKSQFAVDVVSEFIQLDISDHTLDKEHTTAIVDLIKARKIELDGCVTFWEDCVPLTAMVCQELSLCGAGVEGAINAKTKSLTQKALSGRTEDIPHWPRTHLYTSKSSRIESHTDIENAAHTIGFPSIMKLEYGSSAVGVGLMENIEQCHEHFDRVQGDLQTEADHPGIGLGHGNSMVLMDYLDGTEHDIDIIIFRRKLVAAFVSDNGPTQLPNFTETSAAMPTALLPCKRNQLIVAAYQCCTEIGLENGTFNVEMKMTSTGPKLIEINGRMGGFYLRDWIKTCYKVDILLCSFAIACGVKPLVANVEPVVHIMGLMLIPSVHVEALTVKNRELLKRMQDKGLIRLNQFEETVQREKYEEPFCNVAVVSPNRVKAKTRLIEIGQLLGMDSEDFPLSYMLADFCDDS